MTSALSLIARVGSFTCVLLHLQAIGSSHSLLPTCWSFFCLYYRPQRSCGKVMISQASVQTPPRQTPPWEDTPEDRHPPPGRHPRRQTPPTRHTPLPGQTPPLGSACWIHTPGGQCSGQYTSYWNAFFFVFFKFFYFNGK